MFLRSPHSFPGWHHTDVSMGCSTPSSFLLLYFSYFILTTCLLIFLFPTYKLEQLLSPLHAFSHRKLFKSEISPRDSLVLLTCKSIMAGKKVNAMNKSWIFFEKYKKKLWVHILAGNIFFWFCSSVARWFVSWIQHTQKSIQTERGAGKGGKSYYKKSFLQTACYGAVSHFSAAGS